jgi:hypothetical protein
MSITDRRVGVIPEDKIMLREIVHVCIVVKNVEKTAETFAETFGIGPFEIREKNYPPSKAMIRGEHVEYTLKRERPSTKSF